MRRRGPWLLAAALLGVVWAAAPVAAHTVLVDSDPADGAILTAPIDAVVLRFNEPVQGRFAEVAVTAPGGERVDVDGPTVSGNEVIQALAPLDEHGDYEVRYRVLAADDHPVTGELHFEVAGSHTSAAEDPQHVPVDEEHADAGSAHVAIDDEPAAVAAGPPPAPERRSLLPLAVLLAAALGVATVDGLRRTRVVALPGDTHEQVVVVDVTDVNTPRSRR